MAFRVNGEFVGDDRFHREFLKLSGGLTPQQVEQHSRAEYRQLVQAAERNVLRSVLFQQFGIAQGFAVSEREAEDERRRAWGSSANQSCGTGVTADMVSGSMLKKVERHLTRHVQRPNRREVEAVYRHNQAAFLLPERWLVSHIVRFVEDDPEREAAQASLTQAAAELKRGKPFAAVAERYSDCKGDGGSLGWISRGTMASDFEQQVFALERRRVSGIFATVFGLHLAVVHDHKPAGVQPLEEVRAELAKRLFEDRRQTVLDQAFEDLARHAAIEVSAGAERSVAMGEKAL